VNIKDLTYVALKITGVFSLIFGIQIMGRTFYAAAILPKDAPFATWYFLAILIPFVFIMLVSFLLLAKTEFTLRLLSLPENNQDSDAIKIEDFLHAAFAILAVYFLIEGISKLIAVPHFIQSYLNSINPETGERHSILLSQSIYQVIEIIIKIIIGLYLFFGGDGLIRLWQRYRDKKLIIE
jgi:hypothetical protein